MSWSSGLGAVERASRQAMRTSLTAGTAVVGAIGLEPQAATLGPLLAELSVATWSRLPTGRPSTFSLTISTLLRSVRVGPVVRGIT